MITITNSDRYTLRLMSDHSEQVAISGSDRLALQIETDKRIHAQVWITYDGKQLDLQTQLHLGADSELAILFWNRVQGSLDFTLEISGEPNAKAHIGIGDLTAAASNYRLRGELEQAGQAMEWTTVCLAGEKHWQLEVNHRHSHTDGLMKNFAVVKEAGDYVMRASGRIVKGAYASQSHQSSRVLTMASKQQSEVLPILYIDENDVKASHATTLGQPDENQLYYLQSRGLSRQAALGLLTLGYLLPINDVLNEPTWLEQLQREIEEKVINDD